MIAEIYHAVDPGTTVVLVGRNLDALYENISSICPRLKFIKIEFDFVDAADERKRLNLVREIVEVVKSRSNETMFLFAQGLMERQFLSLTSSRSVWNQVAVNFLAPIMLTHGILQESRDFYSSKFLFLSSCAVSVKAPGTVSYTASKQGLEGYVAGLSSEFEVFKAHGFARVIRITQIDGGLSTGLSRSDIESLHERFPSRFSTSDSLCRYISGLLHGKIDSLGENSEWLVI